MDTWATFGFTKVVDLVIVPEYYTDSTSSRCEIFDDGFAARAPYCPLRVELARETIYIVVKLDCGPQILLFADLPGKNIKLRATSRSLRE